MSSEKFEDLEDELKGLHEDISGKINNKIPKLSGGKYIPNFCHLAFLEKPMQGDRVKAKAKQNISCFRIKKEYCSRS